MKKIYLIVMGLAIFTTINSFGQCNLRTFVATTAANCSGGCNGTATARVFGGTAPYTYIWSTSPVQTTASVTNLCTGTYTVTIADSRNCTATATAVIAQGNLRATTATTAAGCGSSCNGTATATPTGGTAPYTYSWSTSPVQTIASATKLCVGTYTVTVHDQGNCTVTATATIVQGGNLRATTTNTAAGCGSSCNGTATTTATGGTAPYTYSWSTSPVQTTASATKLCVGTYTVTVQDQNQCTVEATTTIASGSTLRAGTTTTTAGCSGSCVGTATARTFGGSAPYTYNWSTSPVQTTAGATNLCVGTYTVTVQDQNQCAAVVTATIAAGGNLRANTTTTAAGCLGSCTGTATARPLTGTAPYTYIWSTSPAQITAGATSLCVGTYTVTILDQTNCSAAVTAVIAQSNLTANTTTTPVTCSGGCNGTATARPFGGTAPYTYSWSTSPVQNTAGATNLCAGTYTVNIQDQGNCTAMSTAIITQTPPIAITFTKRNVLCHGGTGGYLTANVTGGTAPYTYTWSTTPVQNTRTATGLAAGAYTLTVTDRNGCFDAITDTITQPLSGITVTTTNTVNSSCDTANGSATIQASGGTPPYTYAWNTQPAQITNTAINLASGIYAVTVTDNNTCVKIASVTVGNNSGLTATLNVTRPSCNGSSNGSATATPSGGTPPYIFSWQTTPVQNTSSIINLAAGTYTVKVTDSILCSFVAQATITQPTQIALRMNHVNAGCNGSSNGSASVIVTGGTAPYTYLWSTTPAQTADTVNNLKAGTYTVSVTDKNGCIATNAVTITQSAALAVTLAPTEVLCNGGNTGRIAATVTGGTAPYTYVWSTTPVQNGRNANGLTIGNYTLTVSDRNGCTLSMKDSITQPTAINVTTSSTAASCDSANGSASVQVTGGTTPYTYAWNTNPVQRTNNATKIVSGNYSVVVTDRNGCTATGTATVSSLSGLTATVTGTNISCLGNTDGSATAIPSGGTAPYTYLWSTRPAQTTQTIKNLAAGTYAVTVTDANLCAYIASVQITRPAQLIARMVHTNPGCYGSANGTATITATGGTSPYSYSWSTTPVQTIATINNLTAGTYVVTVTDSHGCAVTQTANLTQPTALTVNLTETDATCNGGNNGSITATAIGGTNPYTYSWSTTPVQTTQNITGLAAGTYKLIVTDRNNCIITGSSTVSQPAALNVNVSAVNSSCGSINGSATATVTGGTSPYSYIWNTIPVQTTSSAINLNAGNYVVTVTDAKDCSTSSSVTINNSTGFTGSFTSIKNVLCNGDSTGSATITPNGGQAPYTYKWSTIPIQTSQTAVDLQALNYTVTIQDKNSCIFVGSIGISQPANALSATIINGDVSCYSGTNGISTVTASGGISPYSYNWDTSPIQTSNIASNLSAGTYSVTVTDNNGCSLSQAAVINQPSQIATNLSSQNVQCNGVSDGAIYLTVNGGTQPYTYLWSTLPVQATDSVTGLSAGTYTVTITDSQNCKAVSQDSITQPSAINITVNTTDASCGNANGSASLSVTGGIAPYTYSWNTSPVVTTSSISGMKSGVYSVTVTDSKGCTQIANAVINSSNGESVSVTFIKNVLCAGQNNGEATVSITGGTPPYIYSWNTVPAQTSLTATGLTAGVYVFTSNDKNNCPAYATVEIIQPDTLSTFITSVNLACNGIPTGQATAVVTGGIAPYKYSWNSNPVQTTATATDLLSSTYLVTVTDLNGCTSTATTSITQPDPLTVSVQTSINCGSGSASVSVNGGVYPYSYQWNTNPVQTTPTINVQTAGIYTVLISDANNCSINKDVNMPISNLLKGSITKINPSCNGSSDGSLTVNVSGGSGTYTYDWSTMPAQTVKTATNLAAGIYYVAVSDSRNCNAIIYDTLTNPPAIYIKANITKASCGNTDGAVTTTVTGGNNPYTYLWNNSQKTANISGLLAGIYNLTVTDFKSCIKDTTVVINNNNGGSVAFSSFSNLICYGENTGSATATDTGSGVPPFTFVWSTVPVQTTATAVNLGAGQYTVTVTDSKGCPSYGAITIKQMTPIIPVISANNLTCYGDSNAVAQVTTTGGIGYYTYAWSTTPIQTTKIISNLSAALYTVTVTDISGCIGTATVNISQPDSISAYFSQTGLSCTDNSSLTVILSGGTSPYTYQWSSIPEQTTQTAVGLSLGAYTVTVTDYNGCADVLSGTLTNNVGIQTNITEVSPLCYNGSDGSITAVASNGTEPYAYIWSTNPEQASQTAIELTAGTYVVTVTDYNGCDVTASGIVTQPAPITISITQTHVSCSNCSNGSATVQVSGGISPYIYAWSTVPEQQTDTASNLKVGGYNITITDMNNCTAEGTVNISINGIINLNSDPVHLDIYPNPTSGDFWITFNSSSEQDGQLKILNLLGQPVYNEKVVYNSGINTMHLNLSNQPKGIYLLQIYQSGSVYAAKIILE